MLAGTKNLQPSDNPIGTRLSTHVSGTICYLCLRSGHEMPQGSWSDSNHVPQHSGVDASQAQSSLFGVDAIVNCAGTLQDAPGDSTAGVHHKGVASLIAACEKMGVRRFIHLSAIGVDRARVWSFTGTVRLFRRWMRR